MTYIEHIRALREALGGRRFLMTIGAGVVSSLLLIHGFVVETTWLEAIKWTVAVYIAGNTIQKVKDVFTKAPAVGDRPPGSTPGQ